MRPEGKPALVAHLRRAAQQGDIALPAFETLRARQVRARAHSRWAHIDDTARQLDGEIRIEAIPGAVTVLVPPRSPAERIVERRGA